MEITTYKIIYEDEWLMVVDKPAGMLVIPTPKRENNTLGDLLNRDLEKRGIAARAHPCHRLDRETSGLIIYAKGKKAQRLMMDEFRKKAVKKRYIAFIHGSMRKDSDTIKSPVYNKRTKKAEPAMTKYHLLERKGDFTVIEAEPITGKTNQIRVHFKNTGHPLVGESVYAFRKDFKLKFRRTALHAARLEFIHPIIKKRMTFNSELPSDMKNFYEEQKNIQGGMR
jgi:23S rRNA pseudouridine1911/1915/1917 synthase